MNYLFIYERLIETRKNLKPHGKGVKVEVHHIIPRCIGGGDVEDNLVALTPREHFISHKLLHKIYPDNVGLAYSVFLMSNSKQNGGVINSRLYEKLRRIVSDETSKRFKGKKLKPSQLKNMSSSSKKLWSKESHRKKVLSCMYHTYVLVSPTSKEYVFTGPFNEFCSKHNLSRKMLTTSYMNGGVICRSYRKVKSERVKNTEGWACCIKKSGVTTVFKGELRSFPSLEEPDEFKRNKSISKTYKLSSPKGEVTIVEHSLKQTCTDLGLSFNMIWDSYQNDGKVCSQGRNKTDRTIRTVGWSCKLM